MIVACNFLFAGFCFMGIPIEFNGVDAGIGDFVRVQTSQYVAYSKEADMPEPLDWRGSPKACADDGSCAYYWKYCQDVEQKLTCRYDFALQTETGLQQRSISVEASDESTLQAAESLIGYQIGPDKSSGLLLLKRFSQRSLKSAPKCQGNLQACQQRG